MDAGELERKMIRHLAEIYGRVIPRTYKIEQFFADNYSLHKAKQQFELMNALVAFGKNQKILDMGHGFGFFLLFLLESGYDAYGADIDPECVRLSRELLEQHGHDPSRAALVGIDRQWFRTGFPTAFFDVVTLNFVVEHVSDISSLFREIARITRPGGRTVMICPNYLLGYEPHYYLFLPKVLPRDLVRLYLKLTGRNSRFIDSITYVTPRVQKVLDRYFSSVENIGSAMWEEMFRLGDAGGGRSIHVTRLVKTVRRLHLLPFVRLLSRLGFYTPLVYVATK
jgi:2-polyprenyl-3-methyl-5-hydroxy-6-metoxy-1,4-benzoquinol methylase